MTAVEDPAGQPRPAAAATRGSFAGKLWFWLPWPPLVALDLWSKSAVFAFLAEQYPEQLEPLRSHPVFTGPVSFALVSWGNPGTVWGLFQNSTIPLMVVRCAAIVGLLVFAWRTARRARVQQLVMSLIFAGAVGNLYDNFFRADRTVRDFLRFTGSWPCAWDFPAFNVADSCITCGAIALFLLLWREDRGLAKLRPAR